MADKANPDYSRMEVTGGLWDEDEAMMIRREALLEPISSFPERGHETLALATLAELRARLPLRVELDIRPLRVLALGAMLVAHSTICPHMLRPLEEVAPEGDTIECPWHRYRFDLSGGKSCDSRALRLMPAPRVLIGLDERVRIGWS